MVIQFLNPILEWSGLALVPFLLVCLIVILIIKG